MLNKIIVYSYLQDTSYALTVADVARRMFFEDAYEEKAFDKRTCRYAFPCDVEARVIANQKSVTIIVRKKDGDIAELTEVEEEQDD